MSGKTKAFILTLAVFFAAAAFLTFYSKQVYLANLPRVEAVMPVRGEKLESGRYAYTVPASAIHYTEQTHEPYVLVLKEVSDVLGDNYFPEATKITLLTLDEAKAVIDGLVYVNPVILSDDPRVLQGSRLMPKDAE